MRPAWKPKLRGVSHGVALIAACAGAVVLWPSPLPGARLYALAMVAMFGASALLHLPHWSERATRLLQRVDHCMIFLAIAATYTPYALLEGHASLGLWVMWSFALAGAVLSIAWLGMPRTPRALLYVAMGLSTTTLLYRLPSVIGWLGVLAHCAAAVLYISGAAVWARRWPDPSPKVFGFHEVFHLLVIAGTFTQYAVLLHVATVARGGDRAPVADFQNGAAVRPLTGP